MVNILIRSRTRPSKLLLHLRFFDVIPFSLRGSKPELGSSSLVGEGDLFDIRPWAWIGISSCLYEVAFTLINADFRSTQSLIMKLMPIVVSAWTRNIKINLIYRAAHNVIFWIIILSEIWRWVVLSRTCLRPTLLWIDWGSEPKAILRHLNDLRWNLVLTWAWMPYYLLTWVSLVPVDRPAHGRMLFCCVAVDWLVRTRSRNIRHYFWIHKFSLYRNQKQHD